MSDMFDEIEQQKPANNRQKIKTRIQSLNIVYIYKPNRYVKSETNKAERKIVSEQRCSCLFDKNMHKRLSVSFKTHTQTITYTIIGLSEFYSVFFVSVGMTSVPFFSASEIQIHWALNE